MIVLGRGGISSAPEFMKSEENNFAEKILPLLEFSKYFIYTFILNSNLKLFQKNNFNNKNYKIKFTFNYYENNKYFQIY